MELQSRRTWLLVVVVLAAISSSALGDGVRRLRRNSLDILEVDSAVRGSTSNNEFGNRGLKTDKTEKTGKPNGKDSKAEKTGKPDGKDSKAEKTEKAKDSKAEKSKDSKAEKTEKTKGMPKTEKIKGMPKKKVKDEKAYEKLTKTDKAKLTRMVDIGGGVMMSMPLDVIMMDMSMSMSM